MVRADFDLATELLAQARKAQAAGDHAQAEAVYRAAAEAGPRHHAVHHDRGGFYKLVGDLTKAEESLRIAHRIAPQDAKTRHALGIVLMSQGRYREGWPLYDARHELPELGLFKPSFPQPEWRGEALAGKTLLIFPEQGLGDQIQFARFAPWAHAQGADVTLICHPALVTLFADSFPVRVLGASGQVDFPDPDYWVMSGSIAGRTGLQPDELPNAPYLSASAAPQIAGARIGVATKGNPAHANDANRSLPAALALTLLSVPGAISLLPEDTGAADFADTARIIAGLDLVVSVDTSVAHLAAAMGKETWILIPRLMTDWRWQEGVEVTPWYPTARLIRQGAPGDWSVTITAARDELRARVAAGPRL